MELELTYKELRQTTNRIIQLISDVSGFDKRKINLNTAVNNTIGIQGDDWDDVLTALYNQEQLTLEGLEFYDYFYDESQLSSPFPLNIIMLPLRLISYLIFLGWRHASIKEFFFYGTKTKPDLTIADLVTSKLHGRFIKRQDCKFRLKAA
jgi:hypothetical protein